ncbi:ribonuclease Z [Daejeonella oryzae]|uniref:ribonuclease Z n=1 Tax=Daejeonella oryzae TaxID=1122943 RepID=UPI00040CADCF|nr:ribonuclease Z [Daejeonella oryzae]
MKFEVTILGSSSATPLFNRNPSAQLINVNEKFFLLDCGEGTQQQLLRYGIKATRIDDIFISHLHGDHYLGIVGLLSSLHLNGRSKPLNIYGPTELQEILEVSFRHSQTILRYEINFHPTRTDQNEKIFENYDVIIETFPLEHRIPCTGFKFSEKQRLPRIIKEKVDELNISVEEIKLIKRGYSFTDRKGKIHLPGELTTEADKPKSYAYCSDTICNWKYLDILNNTDLLYHESTFMHDMLERAKETFHTTSVEAAEVALKADVKCLLIGHFSARYRDLEPMLLEARNTFPNTLLAEEGRTFEV